MKAFYYLKKVLRLKLGGKVNIFNGIDGEWQATIIDEKKNLEKKQKESEA